MSSPHIHRPRRRRAPSSTPARRSSWRRSRRRTTTTRDLPGARNLPHDSDEATIAAVLPDQDTPVVVYCSNLACPNSTILGRRLVQLGYTDVREYEAGKEDWITAGSPVESSRR